MDSQTTTCGENRGRGMPLTVSWSVRDRSPVISTLPSGVSSPTAAAPSTCPAGKNVIRTAPSKSRIGSANPTPLARARNASTAASG
ncbi:MAG: hypothetical protein ABIK28_18280, partial [Planctomycetota bacterium]